MLLFVLKRFIATLWNQLSAILFACHSSFLLFFVFCVFVVSVRVQLIRDQSVELYCGGHTQSAPVLSPLLLVPRAAPTRLIPWSWWCIFFSSSACLRAKKLALIDDAVNRAVGVWWALIESDTAFFLFLSWSLSCSNPKKATSHTC